MNKTDLEKLTAYKLEAKHLQEQIRDLPVGDTPVVDSIKDYSFNAKGSIQVIRGFGMNDKQREKRKELVKRLNRKLADIQDLIAEMEDWLDSLPDPEIRDILRLTYINGLTQAQIGKELGYERSTISVKLTAFWKTQKAK